MKYSLPFPPPTLNLSQSNVLPPKQKKHIFYPIKLSYLLWHEFQEDCYLIHDPDFVTLIDFFLEGSWCWQATQGSCQVWEEDQGSQREGKENGNSHQPDWRARPGWDFWGRRWGKWIESTLEKLEISIKIIFCLTLQWYLTHHKQQYT